MAGNSKEQNYSGVDGVGKAKGERRCHRVRLRAFRILQAIFRNLSFTTSDMGSHYTPLNRGMTL